MQRFEILRDFEQTFPADQLCTLNTTAWPYIKNKVAMSAMDSAVRLDTGNSRQIFSWNGIKVVARSVANLLHICMKKRGQAAFFGASTGIATEGSAGFKDYYFPYYDLNPQTCQYFSNCGNLAHLTRHAKYMSNHNIVIDNYLLAPLRSILGQLIFRLPLSNRPQFREMSSFLLAVGVEFSARQFRLGYSEFIAGTLIYSLLFRLTRPSRVYVISAYSKCDLVAAAHRCGLYTIEIQHGILGRFHPGYNYANTEASLSAPDRVDVYNDFWKDELAAGCFFRPDQIRVVGRLKYEELPPADPTFARTLIFTGQAAYREELLAQFHQWDTELFDNGYKLLYIPHPKETAAERNGIRDRLRHLRAVDIYEGDLTTEHLIKSAAAHLSLFSACHFDAVHLTGCTYVLSGNWSDFMRPYIERYPNWFLSVENVGDIIQHLGDKASKNVIKE